MNKPFLTGAWRKLILINYAVDPEILAPYIPKNTHLDSWNGRYYITLAGFLFTDVKVMGVALPAGYKAFPEINLRFYVYMEEDGIKKRGVVFIREITDKKILTIAANLLFNEHYRILPVTHQWEITEQQQRIRYTWKLKNTLHYMQVDAELTPIEIEAGSEAEFITENHWGYTKRSEKNTGCYEVQHKRWLLYPLKNISSSFTINELFGEIFVPYLTAKPVSVFLAEGSPVQMKDFRIYKP